MFVHKTNRNNALRVLAIQKKRYFHLKYVIPFIPQYNFYGREKQGIKLNGQFSRKIYVHQNTFTHFPNLYLWKTAVHTSPDFQY